MELHGFDEDYLRRLQAGDVCVERDFIAYFSELLLLKLRCRLRSSSAVEDLCQETFLRVLKALRSEAGIRQPDRLGPFVNSVCNNVLLEHYRASGRHGQMPENHPDPRDHTIDLEGDLVTRQTKQQVKDVLDELPSKDRDLLRAVFLEERDKDEVCREFHVDRDYLRVLLHRAKQNFKGRYKKHFSASL